MLLDRYWKATVALDIDSAHDIYHDDAGDKSITGLGFPNESSLYLIPLLPTELSLSSYLFPLLERQPILAFEEKYLYLNHDAPLP